MAKEQVGTVRELWRYPVKSMLGESLEEVVVAIGGLDGDRAWALRSAETGNILSAKKWPRLLDFRCWYAGAPGAEDVIIRLPGGATVRSSDPGASRAISEALGAAVQLERAADGVKSKVDIDPATVFGEVPVEDVIAGFTSVTLPPVFKLPPGTFYDSAAVHVLASGTLEHVRQLCGEGTVLDPRRFRPNIYVETGSNSSEFVEDAWAGGTLTVGDSVRIVEMRPALRCIMTTLPQAGLPRDPSILKTAAKHHQTNVGVFASIAAPGAVRVGDPVYIQA